MLTHTQLQKQWHKFFYPGLWIKSNGYTVASSSQCAGLQWTDFVVLYFPLENSLNFCNYGYETKPLFYTPQSFFLSSCFNFSKS